MFKFRKERTKTMFIVLAFVLSVITAVAVFIGLHNEKQTTESVSLMSYEIGTVDESGKIIDSRESIVMTDAETVDGLTIDIDEESATVTYRVVFYDEDGKYLSTTESLETDYDATTMPENADSFRVVVTPYQVDGEDVKINFLTMNKYAKQLEISYNK